MQLSPETDDQWLEDWIKKAFSPPLKQGDAPSKIGLAVSGGGDSIALLHLALTELGKAGNELFVATVDHGLRAEARDEARFVAEICAERGVPHDILTWDGWDGQGNLQAHARAGRYALLSEWGTARNLDLIALGHTQDDVAEGFLMRLSRGSGLDGLAAMEPCFERNGMRFIRPLLSITRASLRSYLTRHGQRWCEDPSNEDERFQRVATRKVMAALAPLGLGATELSDAATELQQAKSALRHFVREHAETIVDFQQGDIVIAADIWKKTHAEIARRLMNAMLQWVGGTTFPPRADAVTELEVTLNEQGARTLNGCLVTLSDTQLRVAREYSAVQNLVGQPGALWDERWILEDGDATVGELRALGEAGLRHCPDWRDSGLPRRSLLASPAIWNEDQLIAAPLAGLTNGWCARLTRSREQFLSALLSH